MIELKNLCGGYGTRQLLHNITVSLPDCSIIAVVGPNGCGKSTLLRTICGLIPPVRGEILLNGTAQQEYTQNQLARTVSFLPQNRVPPSIQAETLVLHGRFPYMGYPRHYREEDKKIAREAMEWAGISHLRHRNVSTLSGGEQQKVYLAMLLAQNTPIVLMDEPTAYLDISQKFDVIRLARDMKQAGKTVVMVLHDLELALKYADRILLMEQGNLRSFGTPETVVSSGELARVFQVRLQTLESSQGIQYFFCP